MFRAVILMALAALTMLLAATFAWLNPDVVSVDLAFARFEVRKSFAFATALGVGWLLGWLSTAGYLLALINERRKLRKSVRVAETQLDTLRSLPMRDAG